MKKNKTELIVHIVHGCDSLLSPEGESCYGCYLNGEYEAYVCDDIPADQMFHTIAHEYMHYLQDIEGRESDEEEANAFGYSVFTPCYRQGKKDLVERVVERFEAQKKREKKYSVPYLLWDIAINIVKEEGEM